MSNSFNMAYSYPLEVERAKKEHWPVLIPVGTMEYHSTHCPFGCDALVSQGMAEKFAERVDCMIMPTIWYGVASYAVGGPDKNTIHVDCDTMELYIYKILKSLFMSGFQRNIFLIVSHQLEDYMPMTLACMKAAKKLIMEYLEETDGYGWWGKNENKDFYESLNGMDSPWNWIRVLRAPDPTIETGVVGGGGGHGDINECSVLEYLYPGSNDFSRLKDSTDWFAQTADQWSMERGAAIATPTVDWFENLIKNKL